MVILTNTDSKFDELMFFAQVKKRPGLHLGQPSLVSFRDQLFGMSYAFSFYCQESPLKYFSLFVDWYKCIFLQFNALKTEILLKIERKSLHDICTNKNKAVSLQRI